MKQYSVNRQKKEIKRLIQKNGAFTVKVTLIKPLRKMIPVTVELYEEKDSDMRDGMSG